MDKKCNKCGEVKPIEDFSFKSKKDNKRHTNCKLCMRKYNKSHYQNNKDAYYDSHNKLKNRNKQFIIDYKTNKSCEKCGENHPACLQFHHLERDEKEYEISKMYNSYSLKKIKLELAKCIILCANCHFKLHYEERVE